MSWEQVSNSIKFIAFYVASKLGKTGLTVTVDVYNPAGTEVVTGASATELGDGFYYYTLASGSVTTEGEYVAIFKTADTSVDQQHIPALWVVGRAGVEDLDAAISTRLATSGYTTPPTVGAISDQVWDEAAADHNTAGTMGQKLNAAGGAADPLTNTVPGSYAAGSAGYALGRIGTGLVTAVQPISGAGTLMQLVRGDDYYEIDGRELSFSSDDWPDLTGATAIVLSVRHRSSDSLLLMKTDKSDSRVVGTGFQTVVFELAASDTVNLPPGKPIAKFDIQATLSSGRFATLAVGVADVTEDQTREWPGIVHWWDFDGTAPLNDRIGSFHLTKSGIGGYQFADGARETAWRSDGVGGVYNYVNTTALRPTSNFTIIGWAKRFTGTGSCVIAENATAGDVNDYELNFSEATKGRWLIYDNLGNSSYVEVAIGVLPGPNDYHLFVARYNATTKVASLSVDGSAFSSASALSNPPRQGGTQFRTPHVSIYNEHAVDEVGVWWGALLTDADVAALWNNAQGKFWPF